jgi:hypothetical protein
LFRVVVPGVVTEVYTDMRVLLGWAWTYLIVAELIGVSSGITFFINQQAKYRAYDKVFASIILIGLIGLGTDVCLARLGKRLFPWLPSAHRSGQSPGTEEASEVLGGTEPGGVTSTSTSASASASAERSERTELAPLTPSAAGPAGEAAST